MVDCSSASSLRISGWLASILNPTWVCGSPKYCAKRMCWSKLIRWSRKKMTPCDHNAALIPLSCSSDRGSRRSTPPISAPICGVSGVTSMFDPDRGRADWNPSTGWFIWPPGARGLAALAAPTALGGCSQPRSLRDQPRCTGCGQKVSQNRPRRPPARPLHGKTAGPALRRSAGGVLVQCTMPRQHQTLDHFDGGIQGHPDEGEPGESGEEQ